MSKIVQRTLPVLLVVCGVIAGVLLSPLTAKESYPPVEVLLSSSETIIGEPIAYPRTKPEITAVIVNMKPGQQTGWHRHDAPLFGYILEGEVTVDYGEHGTKVYRKGDSLLEAMGSYHNGKNTGDAVARILAVFAGGEGVANTTPAGAATVSLFDKIRDRLALMQPVAAWKKARGKPVEDLAREKVVIEASLKAAQKAGIDGASAKSFFEAQIAAAKEIQVCWIARWQQGTAAMPDSVPDLVKDIRPQLIKLGGDILSTGAQALIEHKGSALDDKLANVFLRAVDTDCLSAAGKRRIYQALTKLRLVP